MASRAALAIAKKGARGEPVIKDVILATAQELGRVGYRALRIEDVAARANVNKTTIYRRWPTKVELVHETLRTMFDPHDEPPDTGTLRGDLIEVARSMLAFLTSPNGQVLVRMMMTEGTEHDLRRMVDSLRGEKENIPRSIFDRARARGELREDVDSELLLSTMIGCLHHRIFAICLPSATLDVEPLVDLVLYGVSRTPPPVPSASRSRRKLR